MPRSRDPFFWLTMARDAIAIAISSGTAALLWFRRRGARFWPTAYGRIESAMTSDVDGWRSNLMYSYAVNGDFYSGVHSLRARNEADADDKARLWKEQNVRIRYSPSDPAISVLRPEDQAPILVSEFSSHSRSTLQP